MIRILSLSFALLATSAVSSVAAAESLDPVYTKKVTKAVDSGLRFLRGLQEKDGSYGSHVGLTSMVLLAFAESHRGYAYDDGPFIGRAADWLVTQRRADGAITGDATPTYNTALAIMALNALDKKKYAKEIAGGQKFLVAYQSDEDQQYKPEDKFYGGIGYGGDERPDLSNLHYALEALKRTDYDPDSDVWEKAQTFVTRCQNRSESNDQAWAGNDGGFVYAPGQSPAGGTRSYGAMSFAGLKSLIFTRVKKDDPRVKSAWEWIRNNYDFNTHPGMDTTSYYYYLQTAAEALRAYGELSITDNKGRKHSWVRDMVDRILSLQKKNGSWANDNKKYWEGNPLLATARSIISINHALRTAGAIN